MEMKKLGATALGTMLAATGVSSIASTAAVAAQSPTVEKTSNVESTVVGDVVTFTVKVTGSPNQMFNVYDTITGYLDNASAPAITSITSESDATGVMTDIWGDSIVAIATLGPSGEFSFTYSILVESLGDAVLQSEVCVEPMFSTTTRRPLPPPFWPEPDAHIESQEATGTIDAPLESEQGALVEEALETEDETPVLASEVAVLNSVEGCMTHEVSIVVPEEPEPEQPEPEQPEPEQPEPEQPEPEQPEPKQPEPKQPEPKQPEPEQPQPALAETGGANTTGVVAASAAALAGLGGSLIAFRRKFMRQKP